MLDITKSKKREWCIQMKIIAILGSPHVNGNGAVALDNLLSGARANGAECIKYELSKLQIANCLGCRKCIENGGNCVLKDDFTEIFDQMKTADLVIIASPIHINQVNGYTKTFLDRCYPLTDKKHKPRFGKRKLVMLWTYGVPIPFIFSRYIRSTSRSLKAMGLIIKKNIIINGCTTIGKVQNDKMLQHKLQQKGRDLTDL